MVQDFFHVQRAMCVIGISCVGLSFFCCFNLFLVWDNLVIHGMVHFGYSLCFIFLVFLRLSKLKPIILTVNVIF